MNRKSDYEIVIIGAGVIGLAIAKDLADKTNKTVLIIEKESNFGKGISSRNSEVIHSGIYYEPNSFKANHCINGRKLLYSYCKNNNIWHNQCGKLIIAQKSQIDEMYTLYNNGINNGLNDLKILNNHSIKQIEPHILVDMGIFIKSTGILDVHELMKSFFNNSYNSNHDYLFKTKVISSKMMNDNYKTIIKNAQGQEEIVYSDWVINCAGLNSDIVGSYTKNEFFTPKIKFTKGSYFKISNKYNNKFKHLVYPMPDKKTDTLGIHLTFDRNGINKLGPNAKMLKDRSENYVVNENLVDSFFKEASKYIKDLSKNDLTPDYAGIRPKIDLVNSKKPDFYINHEIANGLPKWINLIGIESPGITSCLSISDYIIRLIKIIKLKLIFIMRECLGIEPSSRNNPRLRF